MPCRAALCLAACFLLASATACAAGKWDYSVSVGPARTKQLLFEDVPGFTRSIQRSNYALVAAESHVWAPHSKWPGATTAHLISPAVGANFAMYFVRLGANATGVTAAAGIERFVFVLVGDVQVELESPEPLLKLGASDYVYLPPSQEHTISTTTEATLIVFDRLYVAQGTPEVQHGHTEDKPLLPVPGEVFALRRLLPQTPDYDFNMHVMDFQPGEHLNTKEVHYNQHGLLLLSGRGIYRLNDEWHPVQSGDAIWMAPYVPQWYAALGSEPTRYLIYKDITLDPLDTPWLTANNVGGGVKTCGCGGKTCGCGGKTCGCGGGGASHTCAACGASHTCAVCGANL